MDLDERLAGLFLRRAPCLPNAGDLGIVTCPVEPWPHQLEVVRQVTERFPESFLFCDEVGLGKTIEAGLALRQLLISGRVQRALILVPHGLLRQWQEELWEKFALAVPRYEKGNFVDVRDREVRSAKVTTNPWDRHPLILASTQLARRRERKEELLEAEPWDLVLVDEAHHARRKGFGKGAGPNRLLDLLGGTPRRPGLKHRARCLYLLTATPMQVHPVEVWDLLRLLGLGGRWGSREEVFLAYYEELRKPFESRDWSFLLTLLRETLESEEAIDREALERRGIHFEAADWPSFRAVLDSISHGDVEGAPLQVFGEQTALGGLRPEARMPFEEFLRRHTPARRMVWRNTREELRRYRRQGLLDAGVPTRKPSNVWIDFRPKEQELYRRIEAYLSEVYQRYEARRKGLGFLMTVYRRRLTSSFFAIRRSLERRLARLDDRLPEPSLTAEDEIEGVLPGEEAFTMPSLFAEDFEDERGWLEEFLGDLRRLRSDSKRTRLRRDLRRLLKKRPSVLVFTQYTDTLDDLREFLRQDHEGRVACFSGRGGELWDGGAWVPCDKESLKARFREPEGPDGVRILLATEAAGEGLNLQTCGVLINYDMPWNPMRVEQRIGRLDRIGQVFEEIWIFNYFYRDSVEAEIYRRLSNRIGWFEEVVGTLQPILHEVGQTIREVAMMPPAHRRLDERLRDLETQMEARPPTDPLDLPKSFSAPTALNAPVSWRDIETIFLGSQSLGPMFSPAPGRPGAFLLAGDDGEVQTVTFDPQIFDRRPDSTTLLTYGHPRFETLLNRIPLPEESSQPTGLGLYSSQQPAPVNLFLGLTGTNITSMTDWTSLAQAKSSRWRPAEEGAASTLFSRERQQMLRRMGRVLERRRWDRRRALLQEAQRVLVETALVELARDRVPTLFDQPLPYGFGRAAVQGLERHGSPFSWLLRALGEEVPAAHSEDPFFAQVEGQSPARLENLWVELEGRGKDVMVALEQLRREEEEARRNLAEPSRSGLMERRWYLLDGQEESVWAPTELVAGEVRPFENSVPLYRDLAEVARRFLEPDENPQGEEERHPEDFSWAALEGRTRPHSGLFVAQVESDALEERVEAGAWGLFRLSDLAPRPGPPKPGQIVLASHSLLDDGALGSGFGLRVFELETSSSEEGWAKHRIRLETDAPEASAETLVLEEEELEDLRVIAELVEVLG